MKRDYYSDSITGFLGTHSDQILGSLARNSGFEIGLTQRNAWLEEISILKSTLLSHTGMIYFEYSIPRIGKRIDIVLIIGSVIFVIEFKIGGKDFDLHARDQVWDYALDLKNFHESSHPLFLAPILIATMARKCIPVIKITPQKDKIFYPINCDIESLKAAIEAVLKVAIGESIDSKLWEYGRYCPTPTIIEAAMALYGGHSVEEISRSDAGATNLSKSSETISEIIRSSKEKSRKSICFLTGVPGAGKTLVGLNIATQHIDKDTDLYSVFLSGNGPLVAILREALARDKVQSVKHTFRDSFCCFKDLGLPPRRAPAPVVFEFS